MMRRIGFLAVVTALVLSNLGCVVAMGNKGTLRTLGEKQAVAVNGEIYLVDVNRKTVSKFDAETVDHAPPISPSDPEGSHD